MINLSENFIDLLLKKLPEDKVTELRILIEVGDEEKIQKFIGSILGNLEEIIEKHYKEILPRFYPPSELE